MAKKKKKTKRKKMEFSKFAFLCTTSLFGIVIIGSFILMWRFGTTDALPYLIPSVAGLTTTATGFYYHKAKIENTLKISKEYGISINEIKGISGDTDSCYTDSEEV